MKNYRVAVIGSGDRGKAYSKAFSLMDNITMVAACDILEDRVKKIQEDFGYLKTYSGYKDAILNDDIDIVAVCTPAYFHSEIAAFAMKHGKHVISEKPMDLSFENAQAMIACARENSVQLAMGFQYHNIGWYRKVKHALHEGVLGSPVLMRFTDIRQIRPKLAMHDAECGNGGPMVDMSCHFFDLMRWYFKSDPVSVSARMLTISSERPEIAHIKHKAPDTAVITVEYASSDIGVVTVCWGLPPKIADKTQFDAMGPKGLLENDNGRVCAKLESGAEQEIDLKPGDEEELSNPELTVVRNLVSAIENKGNPQVTGDDGLIALACSLAAIKSATQGRPVAVKEIFDERPDVLSCMK